MNSGDFWRTQTTSTHCRAQMISTTQVKRDYIFTNSDCCLQWDAKNKSVQNQCRGVGKLGWKCPRHGRNGLSKEMFLVSTNRTVIVLGGRLGVTWYLLWTALQSWLPLLDGTAGKLDSVPLQRSAPNSSSLACRNGYCCFCLCLCVINIHVCMSFTVHRENHTCL